MKIEVPSALSICASGVEESLKTLCCKLGMGWPNDYKEEGSEGKPNGRKSTSPQEKEPSVFEDLGKNPQSCGLTIAIVLSTINNFFF